MLYLIVGIVVIMVAWALFKRLLAIIGWVAAAGALYFFMVSSQGNSTGELAGKLNQTKNSLENAAQTAYSFYAKAAGSKDTKLPKSNELLKNLGNEVNLDKAKQTIKKINDFDPKNSPVLNKIKNNINEISKFDPKKTETYNNVKSTINKISNFNPKNEALLLAVSKDQVKIAESLIQNGADINMKDQYGRTPLIIAAVNCQVKMVEMLLFNHADANLRDNDNHTALMRVTLLGHMDTFRALATLDADQASLNNKGMALIIASRLGRTEMAKILLKNQANVNKKDGEGRTALMHAAYGGYKTIVRALIDNRADVNAQDNKKNTALTLAQKKGRTEIAEMLKSAGAISQ